MISKYLHNNINVFGIKSLQLLPLGLCKVGSPVGSIVKDTQLMAVGFSPYQGKGQGWHGVESLHCSAKSVVGMRILLGLKEFLLPSELLSLL